MRRRARSELGMVPAVTVPQRTCKEARAFDAAQGIELGAPVDLVAASLRPKTRGECADVLRPCPFVSCRYHLYLDVLATGSLKANFPELEPWELDHSCALDVADAGFHTLDAVGELMNLTRERVRQIESVAYRADAIAGLKTEAA